MVCCLRIFIVLLWLLSQQVVFASQLQSSEGTHFDVVGVDRQSVRFVEELAERVLVVAKRSVRSHPDFFPQRVLVALRPEEHVQFDGPYKIELKAGGFVRVDVRWDASMRMDLLCYCLMDAYLTRYALYTYGYAAPEQMKAWVVSALGMQTYLSLRPASLVGWQEAQKQLGVPPGPSLTDTAQEVRGMQDLSRLPYWLHDALKADRLPRDKIVELYELAIAGGNVQQALIALIQRGEPDAEPVHLHEWWSASMQAILGSRLERYETMDESRAWLSKLADFSSYQASSGELSSLRDLWRLRDDPILKETLSARRELILLHLDQVNPAYFNAAISLGKLYDSALDDSYPHQFLFALTSYLGDFEDTKRLESDVLSALTAW